MVDLLSSLPPRYDALDPEVLLDPYPTYRRLRAAGPLCRVGPGTWGVTRHAEVAELLRDPRLSHHFPDEYYQVSMGGGAASDLLRVVLTRYDPPEHTRLRQLIGKAFSPAAVRRLEPQIRALVDTVLDPALARGEFDLVEEFAVPLTISVIARFIGLPEEDVAAVPRAPELGRAAAPFLMPDQGGASAGDHAVTWLRERVGAQLDRIRAAGGQPDGDTLIARMSTAREGSDRLSRTEIVDNAVLTFFAGFETSICLICTGVAALLAHPDQLALLRADRSLVGSAVEEFLRYDAPIQSSPRVLTSPVEIGGRTLREGRVVLLMLGSANHDERRFADPERLDVRRHPNPHVSFGGGPHFCFGAALSRAEAATVFGRLLDRCAVLAPAGPAVPAQSSSFRSWASIPVAVRAG